MKIDLTQKEIKYIKDVMLFQRLIDHRNRTMPIEIVVKLDKYLTNLEEIQQEDAEDKKYRRRIVK